MTAVGRRADLTPRCRQYRHSTNSRWCSALDRSGGGLAETRSAPAWVPILAEPTARVRAKALKAQALGVTPWSEPKREAEGSRRCARGAPVSATWRTRAFPDPFLRATRSGARRPIAPRAPLILRGAPRTSCLGRKPAARTTAHALLPDREIEVTRASIPV